MSTPKPTRGERQRMLWGEFVARSQSSLCDPLSAPHEPHIFYRWICGDPSGPRPVSPPVRICPGQIGGLVS